MLANACTSMRALTWVQSLCASRMMVECLSCIRHRAPGYTGTSPWLAARFAGLVLGALSGQAGTAPGKNTSRCTSAGLSDLIAQSTVHIVTVPQPVFSIKLSVTQYFTTRQQHHTTRVEGVLVGLVESLSVFHSAHYNRILRYLSFLLYSFLYQCHKCFELSVARCFQSFESGLCTDTMPLHGFNARRA